MTYNQPGGQVPGGRMTPPGGQPPPTPGQQDIPPVAPNPGQPQTQPAPTGYPSQPQGYPQQAPPPGYPQQAPPPGYPQQAPPQGYPQQGQQTAVPPAQPPLPPQSTAEQALGEAAPPDPNAPQMIRTDGDAKDGLVKCPRCGSTDISLNPATGKLRCNFCRYEWDAESALKTFGLDTPIGDLVGLVMGSGADDIIPSTETVLTFKCSACGAEVVMDTDESTQARCHWCRNTLSMNQQIPNGAVPDMVLPFSIPKAEAVSRISEFVKKRRFFANRRFTREFNPENVMGVYLPYMVVDVNAQATFQGQGEHKTREYTVGHGDDRETRYDADLYNVWRQFNIEINDLTVESSLGRLDQDIKKNTNNIINSVMPFDTGNAVKYDSNYLSGFTSERRDTNVTDLTPLVEVQSGDIARHAALPTLKFYDRGVRWDREELKVVGQRWVSTYLPVWLYSYQQVKSNGEKFLHYVAVNGRTGETMGSIPVNQARLVSTSIVVQMVGTALFVLFMIFGG